MFLFKFMLDCTLKFCSPVASVSSPPSLASQSLLRPPINHMSHAGIFFFFFFFFGNRASLCSPERLGIQSSKSPELRDYKHTPHLAWNVTFWQLTFSIVPRSISGCDLMRQAPQVPGRNYSINESEYTRAKWTVPSESQKPSCDCENRILLSLSFFFVWFFKTGFFCGVQELPLWTRLDFNSELYLPLLCGSKPSHLTLFVVCLVLFFKTGFFCVALAVLDLTL